MYNFLLKLNFFFYNYKIINTLNNLFKYRGWGSINVYIDIGSNVGEFFDILKKTKVIKKTILIEPSITSYITLKKKYKKNKNIFIANCAIGEKKKISYLNIFSDNSFSSFYNLRKKTHFKLKKFLFRVLKIKKINKQKIIVLPLDTFLHKYKFVKSIDLIKIDVEGYELKVIKGGIKTLKKTKVLIFENHHDDSLFKTDKYPLIHKILIKNKFVLYKKIKLPFPRNSSDYFYINKALIS